MTARHTSSRSNFAVRTLLHCSNAVALSESWVGAHGIWERERKGESERRGIRKGEERLSRGRLVTRPLLAGDVWDLADDDEESNEFEVEANTSSSSISSSGNRITQGEDREKDREKEPSYYYNRMRGHTAREKPMNYDQIVQARGWLAIVIVVTIRCYIDYIDDYELYRASVKCTVRRRVGIVLNV